MEQESLIVKGYKSQQPPLLAADLFFEQASDDRFKLGKCYSITNTQCPRPHSTDDSFYNPISGYGCLFRFDGLKGRHYYFTEIKGNWRRTFTNEQLIGKFIKEVNS